MMKLLTAFVLTIGIAICQSKPTSEEIAAAIATGKTYKTGEQFLKKGLKSKVKVMLTNACVSRYVTFFGLLDFVAYQSAMASQQMRELKPEEVQTVGNLYALVEYHAQGSLCANKLPGKTGGAHLVLKTDAGILQPVDKDTLRTSGTSDLGVILGGSGWSGKTTLLFAFDNPGADLMKPVTVVLIDGDGKKYQEKTDLRGL
jgi:hypothetical protein